METQQYKTIYRLQSLDTGRGPFMYMVDGGDPKFGLIWNPLYNKYYKYPYVADFNAYPAWQIDFPDVMSLRSDKRIGVQHPCLIYYWFGQVLDVFKDRFGIFEIKVKDYQASISKKQILYLQKDVIEERLLIKL